MEKSAAPTQALRTAHNERFFVWKRRWGIGDGRRRHASDRRAPRLNKKRFRDSGSAESNGFGDQQGREGRSGGGGNYVSDGRRRNVGTGTAAASRATKYRFARECGADSAGVATQSATSRRRGKSRDAKSTASQEREEDIFLFKHTTAWRGGNVQGLSLKPRGSVRPTRGHKVPSRTAHRAMLLAPIGFSVK